MTFVPTAKVICDSVSPWGKRLTTMEVTMHRFVLAEFNTHRVFSRNSASSRAIPVAKILKKVSEIPAEPVEWGKNQSGMQASEQLSGQQLLAVQEEWRAARADALQHVQNLLELGLHKQLANRRIEADLWTTVIVSATETDNFFNQRCHWAAQPEIRTPAEAMREAYNASTPALIREGEWHLPYLQDDERLSLDLETQKRVCVARCARVSYLTHDGVRDVAKDLELFDRLTGASPMHASPLEHVATPGFSSGNFKGWTQFRAFFEGNPDGVMTPIRMALEAVGQHCSGHVIQATQDIGALIRRDPVETDAQNANFGLYRITDVITGILEDLARKGRI